jgi:Gpi18-like mannosyltransferase
MKFFPVCARSIPWAALGIVIMLSVWLRILGVSGTFGYSADFAQAISQAIFVTDASFRDLYVNAGGQGADHPVTIYRYLKIAADLSSKYGISVTVLVKCLYAAAELLTALLVVAAGMFLFGEAAALPVALLYFLVPVFSYVGSYWGHHGGIEVFFTLASLLTLGQRKYTLSFIGLGAALAFRIHSIVIVPFILFAFIFERIDFRTRVTAITAGILTHCALTFPLIWEAGWSAYRLQYSGHLTNYSGLTYGAYNIWTFSFMRDVAGYLNLKAICALIPWCSSSLDNATMLGFFLFSIAYLAALGLYLQLRRANLVAAVLLPSALIYLCFYFLPTRIHERYIYHFLVLCTPLAAYLQRFFIPFIVLVVTTLSSFTFFPSYLRWLQVEMNAGREPSILNELSMLGFFLALVAFSPLPRRWSLPPVTLNHSSLAFIRVASSIHTLAIFIMLGFLFSYEYSGIWHSKSDFLEANISRAQAYDREVNGTKTKGVWKPGIRGFEFPSRHSWWSIKPLSFYTSSGVVRRGVLMHPQPKVTRVLEIPLNSGERHIALHGRFDDNVGKNKRPATTLVTLLVDERVVGESALNGEKRAFFVDVALPNPERQRTLRLEVNATDYTEIFQLNDLHLYLTATVR